MQRRFAGRPPIRPKRASFPRPVTKRSPIDRWVMRLLKLSLHTRARACSRRYSTQRSKMEHKIETRLLAFQPFNRMRVFISKMGNEQTVPNETEREREKFGGERGGAYSCLKHRLANYSRSLARESRGRFNLHKSRRDNNRGMHKYDLRANELARVILATRKSLS